MAAKRDEVENRAYRVWGVRRSWNPRLPFGVSGAVENSAYRVWGCPGDLEVEIFEKMEICVSFLELFRLYIYIDRTLKNAVYYIITWRIGSLNNSVRSAPSPIQPMRQVNAELPSESFKMVKIKN